MSRNPRWHRRIGPRTALWLSLVALPLLAMTAWRVVASEASVIEDLTIQKGRIAALAGAQAYASILEQGVDRGELKLEDLLHPVYEEIQFPVTVEETRYHTQYDHFTDTHGIQAIEDAILLSSPDLIYGVGSDVGTYVPTTHAAYSVAPNGDVAHDRKVSRSKRKFVKYPVQLTAAAYLGTEPLVQAYDRDTGDRAWDVSAPIWVKGQHFGAFRVGVRRDRIEAHKVAFAIELGALFLVLTASLITVVFATLSRAMRPLRQLAASADRLSEGDDLDVELRSRRGDEVGQMTSSLNHVRLGLRAAVRRVERESFTASHTAVRP